MKNKFLLLLVVLFLAGCGTTKTVVVTETKNILITPPDELITRCNVEAPPDIQEYVNATWEKKEDLLIKHSSVQMKNIFTCNKTIDSIKNWKKEQLLLYPNK